MVRKRKFARSIQQEGISRDQISERLKEFGWIPSPTNIDLGEDFIVHIYIEGNPTGKTFHLQAKSVINIDERRKKNFLVYKFKTQDVFDWEQFENPVVLLVWDIKKRIGKWIILEDAINYLEQNNLGWRNNKSTVNLHFPWSNSTDDQGLLALKERIGVSMLPLLLNKKDFSIQTKDTDYEINQKLQSLSISGGKIELSGANLVFPNWFSRWFNLENIQVEFESELPDEPMFLKVTASDPEGVTHFHETELKMIQRSTNSVIFTNDHKNPPIRFELKIIDYLDKPKSMYYLEALVNNFGKTVYENRDLLKFLRAFITSGGGKVFISALHKEPHMLERDNMMGKLPKELEPFLKIIEMLCRVQDHVSELIIYPERGITAEEQGAIHIMNYIIEHGTIKGKLEKLEINIQRPSLDLLIDKIRNQRQLRIGMNEETKFKLFGKEISLGRTIRYVEGQTEHTKDELQKLITNMSEGEVIHVVLRDSDFLDYYLDLLIKEAERVGKLLYTKFSLEKIILFGDLIWESSVIPNEEIQLAILTSSSQNLEAMNSFCENVSLYPINLYRFEDLEPENQVKVLNTGKIL